ncbi:hypothetical protein [Glaciibacter psychrotolerans]|uniref:DUF4190 domain-containing protein n=1 Tax=Glaciibacter psychrotolerans TaxID=670054 RepID=A0A7Z0EH62_9MICO|nr:hypothetical protein [Leifsonia psychrotolerans]NYJ21597.1 hypothetical protein [Leifsonia psychrotolerans]
MTDTRGEQTESNGSFQFDLTRDPAPITGQIEYDSTVTAPTEWVPYVYASENARLRPAPRAFSIAALVCGTLGLLLGLFGVWGGPLAFIAVMLGLLARNREPLARPRWGYGVATGLIGLAFTGLWIAVVSKGMSALTV